MIRFIKLVAVTPLACLWLLSFLLFMIPAIIWDAVKTSFGLADTFVRSWFKI